MQNRNPVTDVANITSQAIFSVCLMSLAGPNSFHVCVLSCFSPVRLFATPWTAAHQAPLSLGFSRQEHCSGLPRPPLEGLPHPCLMRLPALAERVLTTDTTWEARNFEWCECYRSLSMGFLRQESCIGLSCPPPGDLPDPGIEPIRCLAPSHPVASPAGGLGTLPYARSTELSLPTK